MKTLGFAILSLATAGLAAPSPAFKTSWFGWKSIKYLFVFGDSYTQTGFNPNGTQPSPSNPFGNPPYPGWTSANGPNWVGFLSTTYNKSVVQTYNLAYGGATVDARYVKPYREDVLSLGDQVVSQFVPTYGSHPTSAPWVSSDSLFATFIGINDVGNSWWLENATDIQTLIFQRQAELLETLYSTGARNFLFLNVPPINLAPLTLENGNWSIENEGKLVGVWNENVKALAKNLTTKHPEVKIFQHDTHAVYSAVLKDPSAFEQTAGLKNTTGYCKAYENGTPQWNTSNPSCAYPVNQYLWLNNLHPTYPIHNATAASIAKLLNG